MTSENEYKYYFGSLRTPGVLAEIDLFGTFIDMELNVGGNLNGSFQLDQTGKRNADLLSSTIPGYSFVYVERNGIVIWGGYVWSRTYESQAKTCQLFAQSFDMYPNNQLIEVDTATISTLNATDDQRNIFCNLWNQMQSLQERNLGVTIPSATFPDIVTISGGLTILATDFSYYGEVMARIANGDTGFDWYISCSRVGGAYIKNLMIGYPHLGEDLSSSSLVFEYPGSITNYYQIESMTDAGTNIFVTGSGDGSTMVIGTAGPDTLFDNGWPRWDKVVPHKDITTVSLANAIAAQEFATRRAPKTTVKATIKGGHGISPDFGSWGLGDVVRVVIKDPRNPNILDFPGRIVKWSLNPPSATNVEEYNIIFFGDDSG